MSNPEVAERLVGGIHALVGQMQAEGANVTNEDVYCACIAVIASSIGAEASRQVRNDLFRALTAQLNEMIAIAAHMSDEPEAVQ